MVLDGMDEWGHVVDVAGPEGHFGRQDAIVINLEFRKNKNLSAFWALKKCIPWISITFVITYILSQFIWKTPDFNNLLAILMYFWCVWVATTLFFWAAFYAKASMEWKPNPQKIAITKSRPIWFIVITVFLIFSLLIHIIMQLINN